MLDTTSHATLGHGWTLEALRGALAAPVAREDDPEDGTTLVEVAPLAALFAHHRDVHRTRQTVAERNARSGAPFEIAASVAAAAQARAEIALADQALAHIARGIPGIEIDTHRLAIIYGEAEMTLGAVAAGSPHAA